MPGWPGVVRPDAWKQGCSQVFGWPQQPSCFHMAFILEHRSCVASHTSRQVPRCPWSAHPVQSSCSECASVYVLPSWVTVMGFMPPPHPAGTCGCEPRSCMQSCRCRMYGSDLRPSVHLRRCQLRHSGHMRRSSPSASLRCMLSASSVASDSLLFSSVFRRWYRRCHVSISIAVHIGRIGYS